MRARLGLLILLALLVAAVAPVPAPAVVRAQPARVELARSPERGQGPFSAAPVATVALLATAFLLRRRQVRRRVERRLTRRGPTR
jgi:uncharacterized protein (TIGR03382 family)